MRLSHPSPRGSAEDVHGVPDSDQSEGWGAAALTSPADPDGGGLLVAAPYVGLTPLLRALHLVEGQLWATAGCWSVPPSREYRGHGLGSAACGAGSGCSRRRGATLISGRISVRG